MHDGPPLTGYQTSYPALDARGKAVFWRDGSLLAADVDPHQRELFHCVDNDRALMSRILLLEDGTIAFALDNELLIFRDTGLAPLAADPWPCADGGIYGNPVIPVVPPLSAGQPQDPSPRFDAFGVAEEVSEQEALVRGCSWDSSLNSRDPYRQQHGRAQSRTSM